MGYFKQFPKIQYDFNRDGVINNVIDIFRQVRPLQNFVDEFASYQYITVPDGQRPDVLSKKLYDTPNFYWTFFLKIILFIFRILKIEVIKKPALQ